MLRILGWLIGIDIILIIGSLMMGGQNSLINTQIAFASSLLVLTASAFSYTQMVYYRLESGTVISKENQDDIDKLEDPFDLYADGDQSNAKSLKDVIKEEKGRMKQHRRSLLQMIRDSKPSFSLIRLGAYLLLFAGFFYLIDNKLLHIPSYLIGLSLPVVIVVIILISMKGDNGESRV